MKGISQIIAVVLLLMISISLVSTASVWLRRIVGVAIFVIEKGISAQQSAGRKLIRVDNFDPRTNEIAIRNVGSMEISTNELAVYVNERLVSCNWSAPSFAPGEIVFCKVEEMESCETIKVSAPGNTDQIPC